MSNISRRVARQLRLSAAVVAAWLFAPAILSCGAAQAAESLTYLETAGRYADLEADIERRLAQGTPANTTLLSYLCIARGKLKQYDKLFDCADKIEQSVKRGDVEFELDQRVMFISASDARPLPDTLRAQAYLELGEFAKATAAGTKALSILAGIPERGGTSLYPTVRYNVANLEVLALSAAWRGDAAEAKRLALQLEDVSRPFIGGRMWGWMKDNALARVHMAMGRYREALEYIPGDSGGTKILVSFVNGLGPYAYRGDSTTTVIEIPRLVMRGKALAETGKLEEAAADFDSVLATPRIKDTGDLYWISLFERGRIAEAGNRREQAEALFKQAVEVVELQRSTIRTEGSKIGFVGDKQALYGRLVSVLVQGGKAEQALEYVERSKSRALVDMLSSRQDFAARGLDAERARRMVAQLDAVEMPVEAPAAEAASDGGRALRNLTVARQEIRAAAPELATLVSVSAVPAADLKALVGKDETLVEYYYQGADFYAFVLDRERLQVVKMDSAGLEAGVRELLAAIEQARGDAWRAPASALYRQLWQPLEAVLATRNVLVVAHGALHYLPFAALLKPDGSFVADSHALRFLPSASVLKFLGPARPHKGARMLVLGNPDLGDPRLDLPFAEAEARALATQFPDSRLLLRKDASRANFRRAGAEFRRIHFATHGKFEADDPLASGLYLAKGDGDDGVLTVGELYAMNLDADLVTLSACETGLGKVANGDDVVGLARGFLYAGTRSIAASLWSVDDNATAELMKAFYRNLATLGMKESLRQAQNSTRQTFPHPFYWAAFQVTGRGE